MNRFRISIVSIIVLSIALSCGIGFYFSVSSTIPYYKFIMKARHTSLGTFYYFANDVFRQLASSGTITRMKQHIPPYSTIGYYSDLPYGYEYMMSCVLQNLLAPILIDRDHAKKHQRVIMFLKDKDPKEAMLYLDKTTVQYIDNNLFLAGN